MKLTVFQLHIKGLIMTKATYQELESKVDFYEYTINGSRKQIRKILREDNLWKPEFHEHEVDAITALYLATKEELHRIQLELYHCKSTQKDPSDV